MNLNDMARKLKGLVKFLIDWDDDVNVTNEYEDGKAPLHDTEHQGYIKIAELLIKNGANVNVGSGSSQFFEITNVANLIINVANEYGETPLYEATRFGLTKIAELLLKNGAYVNVANQYGNTPLHETAHQGLTEIAELLIKNGADVNVTNKDGFTPLHEAARQGFTEIAELLLKNGADVNIATKYGATPLHVATSFGNKKISELLIKKG